MVLLSQVVPEMVGGDAGADLRGLISYLSLSRGSKSKSGRTKTLNRIGTPRSEVTLRCGS